MSEPTEIGNPRDVEMRKLYDAAREHLTKFDVPSRALEVRALRVDESRSWRAVGNLCRLQWESQWEASLDRLFGRVICEIAATSLGENYLEQPWWTQTKVETVPLEAAPEAPALPRPYHGRIRALRYALTKTCGAFFGNAPAKWRWAILFWNGEDVVGLPDQKHYDQTTEILLAALDEINRADAPAASPDDAAIAVSREQQVKDQCRVVQHLATVIAGLHRPMMREVLAGPHLLEPTGRRTARLMNTLGDILNGMDAVDEADEWTAPIFERAQEMFSDEPSAPSEPEPAGEGAA